MSGRSTEQLIESLAAETRPVRPLKPPLARAAGLLALLGLLFVMAVAAFGRPEALAARSPGSDLMTLAETAAMLLTGIVAVCGAFALSVPGGSRAWLAGAGAALTLWLLTSGAGCYAAIAGLGPEGWRLDGHGHCFWFIVAAGTGVGAPLLWRLSRARPIDPAPVALLGGLGAAALAAFLLQFFHPFAVTPIDLALHLLAVLVLLGGAAAARRRVLRPA